MFIFIIHVHNKIITTIHCAWKQKVTRHMAVWFSW